MFSDKFPHHVNLKAYLIILINAPVYSVILYQIVCIITGVNILFLCKDKTNNFDNNNFSYIYKR